MSGEEGRGRFSWKYETMPQRIPPVASTRHDGKMKSEERVKVRMEERRAVGNERHEGKVFQLGKEPKRAKLTPGFLASCSISVFLGDWGRGGLDQKPLNLA